MIKIETIELAGMAAALTALRLPFGKEVRSDIQHHLTLESAISPGEMKVDIKQEKDCVTATISRDYRDYPDVPARLTYAECLHIDRKDLDLMNTLVKRGTEHAKVTRDIMVWAKITAPIYWWCEMETYVVGHQRLSSESTMHVDCRGLSGDDLVAAKAAIPMGRELTKVDAFSYQALRNIARQRWNHRLPEWHFFVDWIKTLPFSQELILDGLDIKEKED